MTAVTIASGSAVQTKGFGALLVFSRKRLFAAWRSQTEQVVSRLSRPLAQLRLLFVDRQDDRARRRINVKATKSRSLAANCGSRDSLNWRIRCGCSMRAPDALMPTALAIIAAIQASSRRVPIAASALASLSRGSCQSSIQNGRLPDKDAGNKRAEHRMDSDRVG